MGMYFDELTRSMKMLADVPETVFIGQSVKWDGHALFKTMSEVPMEKKYEMPVAEDMQMGITTGLAIAGKIPVSIYPRFDFLLLAFNQLVNHLDKVPLFTEEKVIPKAIIRVAVGSVEPMDPGYQHKQNYEEALRSMLHTVNVVSLDDPTTVYSKYCEALSTKYSTVFVEYGDLYVK